MGHGEIVKLLVGAGAKVDLARTDNGSTPLFVATYTEHGEIVKLLLGAGAKVDLARTDNGNTHCSQPELQKVAAATPLIIAAQYGYGEIVQLLLGAGAKVDLARTSDGSTPLFIAAEEGHGEIVQLLLGAGAKVDLARTSDGCTPLYGAAQCGHGEIVQLLLGAGAKVDLARTDDGQTPLYVAACEGHGEIVQLLLGAGAKVDLARTSDGSTPLFMAAQQGHGEIVQLLVGARANINLARKVGKGGETPLIIAICKWQQVGDGRGHKRIVEALIKAGADQSVKDDAGKTARERAEEGVHAHSWGNAFWRGDFTRKKSAGFFGKIFGKKKRGLIMDGGRAGAVLGELRRRARRHDDANAQAAAEIDFTRLETKFRKIQNGASDDDTGAVDDSMAAAGAL
eukprot:g6518.t1